MALDLQPLEGASAPLDIQPLDLQPLKAEEDKPLQGVGEAALSFGTGMIGGIAGGLAGAATAATKGIDAGVKTMGEVGNALTYEPRSAIGQRYNENIGKVFGYLPEKAGELGGFIGGKLGNENLGQTLGEAGTNLAQQFAPLHLIPKGARKLFGKDVTENPKFSALDKTEPTLDIQPLETPDANMDLYKQHAADLEKAAQEADASKGQEPIAVAPDGTAGTPAEMEGLRASTQDITYENVPPDGVIPRTKPDGSVEVPKGNTWIPDENGIPVRQGLPEEAPGEPPIQNVLNNTPEINALGNAIQEANGPKLGVDDTYGSGPTDLPPLPEPIARLARSNRFGGGQSGSAPIVNDLAKAVQSVISKINDIGSKGLGHLTSKEEYFSKNIPGMKDPISDHITASDTPENIISSGMKAQDIPDLGMMSNVQSGAILTSAKFKDNPVLLGFGRILNEGTKTAEYRIHQVVNPVMDNIKALGTQHRVEVAELLKRESLQGKRYTPEQLKDAGFTKKQIDSYQMFRAADDHIFTETNRQRALEGKAPITKEEAYLASMRNGDWQFAVNDKAGKPVWYVRETSRNGANAAIAWLRKNHGDTLNLDKAKPEFMKDASKYSPNTPRDVLGTYKDSVQALHENNFNDKSSAQVRGFEGDKPWLSPEQNANALMNAQSKYMKNAFQWMSMKDSMAKLKPILADGGLKAKQENAMNYVKQVINSQYGMNNGVLSGLEGALAKMTGRSQSTLYKGVTGVKSALYLQTLGINMAHFLATVTQPFITAPAQHAVLSAKGMKYNIMSTALKSMTDFAAGMARHEAHSLLGKDVNVPMTKIGERALQYAEDNGIVSKNIYNESDNIGGNALGNIAKAITSPTISLPEKMARLSTFMSFVHHLDESGKFSDPMQLMRKAEEMTDKSLTSYRAADRPMVVNKLGATGNLAYTFKSYLFNEFNQLSELGRLAKEGKPTPLVTHLAMLGLVGGALSLPLLNEADGIWNLFKDTVATHKPEWYKPISGNGLKAAIIQHLPDISSYGATSSVTGAALQTRYGTDVVDPEAPLRNLFPMWQDIKELKSVGDFASHPNRTTATEAVYQQMPDAIKGNMENKLPDFQGYKDSTRPDMNPTTINPNDLMDSRAIDYRRTEQDKVYRMLGLHSLPEVKAKQTGYINAQEEQRIQVATKKLEGLLFNATRRGDKGDAAKFGKAYLELNPPANGEDTIKPIIDKFILASGYTPSERNAVAAKSIQQLQSVRRLRDTRGVQPTEK